jgi:hypothetical protein
MCTVVNQATVWKRKANAHEREEKQRQRALKQETNRQNNRRMLDTVLENLPKELAREDYEVLIFAAIDALTTKIGRQSPTRIKSDESREPKRRCFRMGATK